MVQDSPNSSTQKKVKEILGELYDGSLEGYLGVNKTLNNVKQRYYWLRAWIDVKK
jgi:hypothetical protein